jgi:hypothetical protein
MRKPSSIAVVVVLLLGAGCVARIRGGGEWTGSGGHEEGRRPGDHERDRDRDHERDHDRGEHNGGDHHD